ncbi:hypothetical protein H5410_014658 [Solanum commersonii]|uniref:Uncharacterized protein n=1 Tax=Solanum commersonii TaxID=4109 RepID=A0A9J5ZS14_SOLCO|nr:hypothetical protein H5410_014658 [Solanum commersonii]
MLNLELGSVTFGEKPKFAEAYMVRTNLEMPPHKRARGIVINEGGTNRPKKGRTEPQTGGKGKGKRPVSDVPEHNSDRERVYVDFWATLSKLENDHPLQSQGRRSMLDLVLLSTWIEEQSIDTTNGRKGTSVGSPKFTELVDAEAQSGKAMELTKGRITELTGDPNLLR